MALKVGFVGFGFIGKVHALSYRALPFYYDEIEEEVIFRAVATAREETALRARSRFGFERAGTDWKEVVEDPEVDIVHVVNPNVFHADVLCAAMELGKHIYCEKPLTASWDDALRVAEALQRYRGIARLCVQNRFFPATLHAAALARQGFFGDIVSFRGVYLHSGNLQPGKVLNWKARRDLGGGGVVLDLGPHIIDLLLLLCGEVEAVCAHMRVVEGGREVEAPARPPLTADAEDQAVLLLRLKNGAVGTVEVSKVAAGSEDDLRFEVHGTGGAVRFSLMQPNVLEVFDQRTPGSTWQRVWTAGNYPERGAVLGKMAVGWVRAHIASLYDFVTAVRRGKPSEPDLADGVRLQAILEAAYRSAERGSVWEQVPSPPAALQGKQKAEDT